MTKRIRDRPMKFYATLEEEKFITERLSETNIKNRSSYLRKMALDGYIINQDISALKKVIFELNKIGNNLNQIAKIANTYGANEILSSDIKNLREEIKKVWQSLS